MKRWRRQPSNTGLSSIGQRERGYELRENGEILARVSPLTGNLDRFEVTGWYWYGFGINTANRPVETPEQAKAQVMNHIKLKHII